MHYLMIRVDPQRIPGSHFYTRTATNNVTIYGSNSKIHKYIPLVQTECISVSSWDGGLGIYTLPPCTAKRRKTSYLKTKELIKTARKSNCMEVR